MKLRSCWVGRLAASEVAGLALGTPAEIAAAVALLASDEASFFVGETVSPNGGFVTT